ncbi:MAG TPA: beta-ketoacyl synthase N-terminal-like domain-containing protein [Pseudonocardiaceae bacterium]
MTVSYSPAQIAITGFAVHVPGLSAADLPGSPAEPAAGPAEAHTVLGRKGLLAKEPATRLALCATHEALGLPPGKLTEPVPGAARTAVVVASNLGNVATVCDVVHTVRTEGGKSVSPLIAPNASSNIIASTIAMRYAFTGPNLLVSSGATAGIDAIRLGALLIRRGRTHRAVVVGVEPDDEIARSLCPGIRAAAAAVILEPALGSDGLLLGPLSWSRLPLASTMDIPGIEGSTYGAQGVLGVAVAAAMLTGRGDGHTAHLVAAGSPEDGYAAVSVTVSMGTPMGMPMGAGTN